MSARRSPPGLVVAAAIIRDGRLLAARRTEPPELAGGWELPGGKVEPGEQEQDALRREIREELDVEVTLLDQVGGDWALGRHRMRVWLAELPPGCEPVAADQHDALAWVDPTDLDAVRWLPGDREPAQAVAVLLIGGLPGR